MDNAKTWRLYFIGQSDSPEKSLIFNGIKGMERKDKISAFAGLIKLLKHSADGRSPEVAYPTKCHEAFNFKYDGKLHKVWRIRDQEVRIYFYYCSEKIILLPHIGEKREDKLTKGQQGFIEKQIKLYIDAKSSGKVHYEEYEHDHTIEQS